MWQAAGSHEEDDAMQLSHGKQHRADITHDQTTAQAVTADASHDSCSSGVSSPEGLSVRDALAGRTVFLTGATGFVGSLVLEQLLRTCPDIHKVYVLVRQKHGVPPRQRIRQLLFTNPLFHLLGQATASDSSNNIELVNSNNQLEKVHRVERDNFQALAGKVEAIPGDLALPDFGIADADLQKLHAETQVVIHAAASISFDDHIHDAIMHNYMVGDILLYTQL